MGTSIRERESLVKAAACGRPASPKFYFEASPSMRRGQVRVVGPTEAQLEIVLIALLAGFGFEQDDENTSSWCERLAEAVPEGVTLGAELHRSGELQLWRRNRYRCMSVIDELATRVGG